MKILCVIVAFGNKYLLKKCVKSVRKLNQNLDIVIVDNFGGVETSDEYQLFKPGKNLGFAGGVNFALKKYITKNKNDKIPAFAGMTKKRAGLAGKGVGGTEKGMEMTRNDKIDMQKKSDAMFGRKIDWVWLLNPDTEIEIKGNLGEFKGIFKGARGFDVFSPVIYDENGEIWFAGGKIDLLTGECTHNNKTRNSKFEIRNEKDKIINSNKNNTEETYTETAWVSGCSMFVKTKVFEKIGLFDEKFFLFYEDVDFCLRAKKAGFKIGVVGLEGKEGLEGLGEIRVMHKISKSVNRLSDKEKYKIESESKAYFMKKHWKDVYPTAFIINSLRQVKHLLSLRTNVKQSSC